MALEYLEYEVADDGVATVTLNRPDRLNALCWGLMGELEDTLRSAEVDPDVRVIIIRGAGRCFSAGYDFTESDPLTTRPGGGPADGTHEYRGVPEYGRGVWNARAHVHGHIHYEQVVWDLRKPVISEVHGFALAGGSTLALVCDLTFMAADAKIGYPPVRWLATGDNVGLYSFAGGLKAAKEMAFGRMFSGSEAFQRGLVNESVPAEDLQERTRAVASQLATVDPQLMMLNKVAVNRAWEIQGIRTAMDVVGEIDVVCHMADTAQTLREELEKTGSLSQALANLNEPWGGV